MEEQKPKIDFKGFIMIICLVILITSRFIQENDQLNTYLILVAALPILIITIMDIWKEYHSNSLNTIQLVSAILFVIMIISLGFYLITESLIFGVLMISAGVAEAIIDIYGMKNGEFSKGLNSIFNLIYLGIIILNYITLRQNL